MYWSTRALSCKIKSSLKERYKHSHIDKNNHFYLIFDESQYPYECPLIKNNVELNKNFIIETYKVWRFLLKNRLIYDLVDSDSRKRENKKIKYKKVK